MSDTIISLDSSLLIGNTDDISINEAESMTPTDAMLVSLDKRGFIDLELIAQISKMSIEEAVRDLIENGAVFRDPHNWDGNDTEGIVQADEYLSGFVLAKFKQAQEAEKKFPGKFKNNIAQLKKIIPKGTIGRDQIHIAIHNPLGYPFIDAFIEALLGVPVGVNYKRGDPKFTSRVEASGAYRIPSKQRYGKYNTAANKTYGTSDMNALHLIEKMINGTEIVVKEKNYGSRGRPKINHKATQLLLEKSELIAEKWEEWLWSDSVRSKLILTAYEERIGSFVPRVYNFKPSFPGMNNNMALRPYQIENVVQILYSPNTLLALPVGRGKTYIMAAAAMKFKQMNNDKVLIVVPNHIIKQWEFMFKELYPDANILVVEPKHFGPSKRQKVLTKIRDNDFDAIIISKSSFDLITVSSEYKYKKLEAEIKSLKIQRQNITDANNATAKSEKNYLDKIIKKKSDDLVKLGVKSLDEINKIMFDELNINRLFIDDAKTSKARARMLTAVNDGEIRILIGSTDKLGTGTNIQRHLYALHHLSVPWRPADMTQRDGRILREGNLNKSVRIFRYVTEGSFDAFSYQLLEVKMKMINSIVKGNIEAYEADNVDESALSYAEIKALAIGSPLIKKRVIASNELSRLRILRNKELEERNRLKQTIDEIDERREILLKELTRSLQDAKLATTNPKPEDKKTRTQIRELIWTTVECGPPAFSNRTILVYRGFRIFIDRLSFNKDKPSVCISTERSRFEVKIPMKSSCLLRIDNTIDSIESSCEKMQESIKRLSAEKSNILEELNKHSLAEDYYEKINELKNTIQELDFQIEEATIMA